MTRRNICCCARGANSHSLGGVEVPKVAWASGRVDGAFKVRVTGHRIVEGKHVVYALELHRPGGGGEPETAEPVVVSHVV